METGQHVLSVAGQHEFTGPYDPLKDFSMACEIHLQRPVSVKVGAGRQAWCAVAAAVAPPSLESGKVEFTLFSWSILSEVWYSTSQDESTHAPGIDSVTPRRPLLEEWLTMLDADVVALQEVGWVIFEEDLLPFMRGMGYDGIVQRSAEQSKHQPCGVATFWRTKKPRLVESSTFPRALGTRFALTAKQGDLVEPSSECAADMKEGAPTATATPGSRLEVGVSVVIAHLESPQSVSGADKRARQLNSLLAWAAAAAAGTPVLVCRNFNTGTA